MEDISTLPPSLQVEVHRFWHTFLENATPEEQQTLQNSPEIFASLPKVWACSIFVAKNCAQRPARLQALCADLLNPHCDYATSLQSLLNEVKDEAELSRVLRNYRLHHMLRIAWRDLAGWASLEESLANLSTLADVLIDGALRWLYANLVQQWGTPCNEKGNPQALVVLGMGKLGGQELNFSSDIDLIFAYPEAGETQGKSRSRSNQEFFLRLGQQIINSLNSMTADGFVYRVDMRLRPFGDSGPLAISFDAMEEYYQLHARDWERYALVKARIVAGDKVAGEKLLNDLRPFIYRRYLDFNAFEALRTMKALIDQETRRKGLANNIKLGAGGIREVEFTCQAFQLIRGGRQPALQERHLLKVLKLLQSYDLLPADAVESLEKAYRFLRMTENRLQAIEDRQTQTLPDDALNQTRLAFSLDFESWESFLVALEFHQNAVIAQFKQVISPIDETPSLQNDVPKIWESLWLNHLHEPEIALQVLQEADFADSSFILSQLQKLAQSHSVQKLTGRGRERVDKIIPLLLAAICEESTAKEQVLERALKFIEAVAQRSVYLALLLERPQVLKQLVHLCGESAWIAEQLTRYPLLLDELLDPRRLYDPLKPEQLDNALQAQIAHVPNDDVELQMDCLRQFKRAYVLHVAASEVSGNLIVEVTSDYLAALADTLMRRALSMAWDYLSPRHGIPYCQEEENRRAAGFCIVAYGKAGGIELSYSSDLDIVFLHNSRGNEQQTDGEKTVDNHVFFARLAQRIIHILTANTSAGSLYEVDQRLRPGGTSGLLVSSFDAFSDYQQKTAWTWEHQALVRARAVAGDEACIQEFENIRRAILSQVRDPVELKKEVVTMRHKMRDNLDKTNTFRFDLKQGKGGITDIEFIVQYGVLRWAAAYPNLLDTTGMLPLLRLFAKHHLLDAVACEQLSEAYRTYRTETHRLALQNQPALVNPDIFAEHRTNVSSWWEQIMEAGV